MCFLLLVGFFWLVLCFWNVLHMPNPSGRAVTLLLSGVRKQPWYQSIMKCVRPPPFFRNSLRYSSCLSSICLSTKQSKMCLRRLLSYCFAVGTLLANAPGPLCEYPKGSITQKLWFTRGTSRWRAKESAMSLCLLPTKKQQSGIKRGLWFQAHSVWPRGSILNRECRDHI